MIISKSAAEKFTSYKVEKTLFTINGNDILINLYGNENEYKSIPKVGDYIDSKILIASRRKDKRTTLYDFQSNKMRVVDPSNDEIIYTGGGTVVDIDIFSNVRLDDLRERKDTFNQEILEIIENNYEYWKTVAEALEEIIPCKTLTEAEISAERAQYGVSVKHPLEREKNPKKYTDELSYYWKIAHEYIDPRIQWRYDGKSFENFKIQFTILKENPLTEGCKVTGRLNLGVIKFS